MGQPRSREVRTKFRVIGLDKVQFVEPYHSVLVRTLCELSSRQFQHRVHRGYDTPTVLDLVCIVEAVKYTPGWLSYLFDYFAESWHQFEQIV
ncbi:Uncharacterised protein [Mycobacteroides abscessus subsp. abscessus]|nr:Uncharacterised protein [Mycobacteroides abscessus subsp. abscessus]